MAGRTGRPAWLAFYAGKGDIESHLNKDTPIKDGPKGKVIGELKKFEPVKYIATPDYMPTCEIAYNKVGLVYTKRAWVSFNNIQKPSSGGAVMVRILYKPQTFGIGSSPYTYDAYVAQLRHGINTHPKLNLLVKQYLNDLISYFEKQITYNELAEYTAADVGLNIKEIQKDFGECLGPIYVYNNLAEANRNGLKLTKNMKIFCPAAANEPLMDYGLIEGDRMYVISAKAKAAKSNTVKPPDLIPLLKKDSATWAKWRGTKFLNIIETIANNSAVVGTLRVACLAAKDKAEGFAQFPTTMPDNILPANTTNIAQQLTPLQLRHFGAFIKSNANLKDLKNIKLGSIFIEVERLFNKYALTPAMKTGTTNIFLDAVANNVTYIKFGFSGDKPEFEIDSPENLRTKGVYLRAKSGFKHDRANYYTERMGFQT